MQRGVIVGLANHTLLIRKDGTEIPIDDSGAPIRDADGNMRGVVLVFRDFTEHRRAQRELREAKEAAETANKAKDQFLAMLSHELRTPLTPVLATLNLWEGSPDVPQPMRADVQMLRRSVELEARIIDDLLDLTRIARGMLSFSPENTDVHALIEFLADLSRSEVAAKYLKLELRLEATHHHIHTDAGRLQQVLWNILRNAIKFTESGSISITTGNDAQRNIDISIADTGIGMTSETMSRLFVPFEQADPAHSKRYGGLGLGMAISNALVGLLEGKLTATSGGLGRGSTFKVSFPTTRKAMGAAEPEPAPPIDRAKVKLLLIEDHADTARALVRLLGSRGYNITSLATVVGVGRGRTRELRSLSVRSRVARRHRFRFHREDQTNAPDTGHRPHRLRHATRHRAGPGRRLRCPSDQTGEPAEARSDHLAADARSTIEFWRRRRVCSRDICPQRSRRE